MGQAHRKADIHSANQIAGIKPPVTGLAQIGQYFIIGGIGIFVAIKFITIINLAQHQASFTFLYFDNFAIFVQHNCIVLNIVFHQHYHHRAGANSGVFVKNIQKRDIAFTGAIDFSNALNPKAIAEGIPDIRTQTIAKHGF